MAQAEAALPWPLPSSFVWMPDILDNDDCRRNSPSLLYDHSCRICLYDNQVQRCDTSLCHSSFLTDGMSDYASYDILLHINEICQITHNYFLWLHPHEHFSLHL